MQRKKLGLSLGKGYRNLIPNYDSRIHANSARGIKLPQAYKGTYNRILRNPEMLIKQLKAKRISDVKFHNGVVSLKFDGQTITNDIKLNKKVDNIANWGHSLKDQRVFIDKDAPYKPQLAVHEAIEQYVSEKYGLKYQEAHNIAEHFEKKYADSQSIDWDKSQKAILKTKR
jgi:hypothetical protein